jgi:pyruvate dehydrogenase E1 component
MNTATTLPVAASGPLSEDVLRRIEKRVLWLAIRMVDHANRERPSLDSVKVGGHQASSASLVTVMTALWLCELQHDDRISVKPHASPVLHALEYLLGWLDEPYLRTLRDFGGLQAYPSRTKDPVPVDYSTGSVGLGAAAPLFGALVQRYVDDHGELGRPRGRFISLIGDAELDEGNIWEAILDPATRGLSEAVWVIDLNRQSLDRVVPVIRADALERGFDSAGWRVVELKYGRRLRAAFAEPAGELLRRRIDEMPNQEYQQLFAASDEQIVEALERPLSPGDRRALATLLEPHHGAVGTLIRDLGGHDIIDVLETLAETRTSDRPTAIFAYTIKGYGLPIAGHPLNHSAMLTGEHVEALRRELELPAEDEWSRFPEGSPEAAMCAAAAARMGDRRRTTPPRLGIPVQPQASAPVRGASTQEAFGRVLADLSREAGVGDRLVTTAPDVAVSTNLGGWINRVGIYGSEDEQSVEGDALQWSVRPTGQHIELGISEMNLFLLLSQLGLAYEHSGHLLVPIGTVYDPFVCRGLDALIYALYNGARFVIAGTPSGISLSREGGAHQSTITPSIGLELPGLSYVEPSYPTEVDWLLRHHVDQLLNAGSDAESLYLRLSTKPVDPAPFEALRQARGDEAMRADVLAGGYRLAEPAVGAESIVSIVACGALLPEALAARELLYEQDEIGASVVALTSPDIAYRSHQAAATAPISNASKPRPISHLAGLLAPDRRAPIVSVIDGASHSLSFLGGAIGARQIALGVDQFGQCGSLAALYDHHELSPDAIAAAAIAALET